MLTVDDWAEIRRLHRAEGVSIKEIVRRLGVARNTVRTALRSDTPPAYVRASRGSSVDDFEPQIRALLAEFPRMPATVIAERIGWKRGRTVLAQRVAELRPLFVAPDPCQRTDYRPGELAQWDLWFPAVRIPVGPDQPRVLPVIVGVSGYSRVIVARMIPPARSMTSCSVTSPAWSTSAEFLGPASMTTKRRWCPATTVGPPPPRPSSASVVSWGWA